MGGLDARTMGERIAEARGRASMTQAELASAVGLDRSALAKIEIGVRRVTALELSRIAEAVDERIEWFVYDAPPAVVSHRNLRDPGAPSPEIDRVIERTARNVEFLQEHDRMFAPQVIQGLRRPSSLEEAEARASEVRQALGLNQTQPIVNASSVGNKVGLLAFSFDLGPQGADAASILLEHGAIVLINGHLHNGRRRMALAHEWGHCLFADAYTVDWRVAENDDSREWEACLDRFARALLLPAEGVAESWREATEDEGSLRTASVLLGSKFRVDMSTLARRLIELGHIDRSGGVEVRSVRTTKADFVEFNLLNHDELKPPELPKQYEESVLRLFRQEIVSPACATDLLFDTWSEDDLPVLPALPENAIWNFVS
ncbi:MAG TPA: XRE family transcriptional regulator [Pseudonocardiaceae bacterium]|nr:XRE family transcriptional regulator [Pseudonocardiaceae bacterium]